MQLLLDTNIYLWFVTGDARLPQRAKVLMASSSVNYVSTVTLWEIAIKVSIGKLTANLDDLVKKLEPSGFYALPVLPYHAVPIAGLPLYHRDPFDRMLVAQAMSEQMWLITTDAHLSQYSDLVIHV